MSNANKRIEALRDVFLKLPQSNQVLIIDLHFLLFSTIYSKQKLLQRLFRLFQMISSYSALNMMTPTQIAKYLAPCFMISHNSNDYILSVEQPLKRLIQLFIEDYEKLFLWFIVTIPSEKYYITCKLWKNLVERM